MLRGRRAECAAIDRLLVDAANLRSGALVLRGETGIGKSALLSYAASGGDEKGSDMDRSRKLYRSQSNRMIAGVCGGLAEYLQVDATIIRVIFVVLAVLGGAGPLIYLAMWLIVPKQPDSA